MSHRYAVLFLVLFAFPVHLPAQIIVSTIRGSATDPSGAAVANAQITVVNLETNAPRVVTTSASGDFEIPGLLAGSYRLTATQAGFRTLVADNIILEGNQIRRIDVRFELASVGDRVTVQANAGVISTDSAQLQGEFTYKRFDDGPWIADGRGPRVVLTSLPQIQNVGFGLYSIEIAGQKDNQVQAGLDGLPSEGSSILGINLNNLEEVVVVTGSASAEYARTAFISYTTKGGGNQFHGRAAYWHQNPALAARSFFDVQKPRYFFHTYYGQVGGPVRKDKTFFFTSLTGQRWPGSTYYIRTVPTERMRGGDFSQLLTGARPLTVKDPLSGTAFPGNIIPSSRQNASALKVQEKYFPTSNLGGPDALANNYGFLFAYPSDLLKMDGIEERIDHNLTSKNTLFARLMYSVYPYVRAGSYPQFTYTQIRHNLHAVIQDTHIFSGRVLNVFRWGLYRPNLSVGDEVAGVTPMKGDAVVRDLGLQGVNAKGLSTMGFPTMSVTGYSTLSMDGGGETNQKTWDYADSLTWARGRHVFKFGGEYKRYSTFASTVSSPTYGSFTFNGTYTGYGAADFLLGLPYSSARVDPLTNRTQSGGELGIYAQDSFKVNSRLTLELGLRWDKFMIASYDDNLVLNWDATTGNVIIPPGAQSSISPLYPVGSIRVVEGRVNQKPSLRNFAPRIGAAFRPLRSGFVIRGAYGVFAETLGPYARLYTGGPYTMSETFYNSIQGGRALFALPAPFPTGSGQIASQSISGYPLDTKNGRIHQVTVTIERQVRDVGFRASYMGTRAYGLNYTIGINKPQPSLIAFSQSRRPYPQFVGVTWARNDGESKYDSLTLEALRKIGHVSFDTHWTWASNFDNTGNLENPYAPLLWNRASSTARHRVVVNVTWDLPVGHGRRFLAAAPAVINHVLGGWQLYWIGYMQTGQFFNPSFSGFDASNTNTSSGLPDRIGKGTLPPDQRTLNHWFDASAFVTPPKGRFGNSGSNILEGPGLHAHNLSIGKRFRLGERFSFTYTMAFQNVLNHPNFSNPAANISTPGSVGVISSSSSFAPGRQIMMRGRLEF